MPIVNVTDPLHVTARTWLLVVCPWLMLLSITCDSKDLAIGCVPMVNVTDPLRVTARTWLLVVCPWCTTSLQMETQQLISGGQTKCRAVLKNHCLIVLLEKMNLKEKMKLQKRYGCTMVHLIFVELAVEYVIA